MLFEQEQRHNTGDTLSAKAEGKLTLHVYVKTAVRVLVLFELEDTGIQKAIHTHICWHDSLDDQFCWVLDSRFSPADLQRKTHAISILHQLESIALTKRAIAEFVDDLLPVCFNFVEIHSLGNLSKFFLQVFEDRFVLERPLVELFLHAHFPDSFVGAVVQLGDLNVGDLLGLTSSEYLDHFSHFNFAVKNLTHQLALNFSILDLLDCLHELI